MILIIITVAKSTALQRYVVSKDTLTAARKADAKSLKWTISYISAVKSLKFALITCSRKTTNRLT
jgi:hypothetical protein